MSSKPKKKTPPQPATKKTKPNRPDTRNAQQRARKILAALKRLYPHATTALTHQDPLQLLVATILSAQCTDERVNRVTQDLFSRYRTAKDYASARPETFEKQIQSTGFYRNKTKSILAAAAMIEQRHAGRVPDNMQDLVQLPGVARKTANVVLGTAFGKNEGIVVDTHVGRLAWRLGLVTHAKDTKDAEKIEQELMQLFPRNEWTFLGHALILHGRKTCHARQPDCPNCALAPHCPSAQIPKPTPLKPTPKRR